MNRILVVDDNPGTRNMLTLALENEGYGVETAADGLEALADIDRESPTAVLLDMQMPRLDGADVARRLHERGPYVPIVIMTGDLNAAQECREARADAYLMKPFTLDALYDTLRRVRRDN